MQTCINNKYLNMSVQSFISEFIGIILNLFEDDPLSLSLNEYVCKDVALVFIAAYSYACGVCVHFFLLFHHSFYDDLSFHIYIYFYLAVYTYFHLHSYMYFIYQRISNNQKKNIYIYIWICIYI